MFAYRLVRANVSPLNRLKPFVMKAKTPEETFDALGEFINDFGADLDALADKMSKDHPTLQQKYYSLCAKFIKRMAEKTYTDARTEFAASQCKKLYDVLKETGCGMDGTGAPCI